MITREQLTDLRNLAATLKVAGSPASAPIIHRRAIALTALLDAYEAVPVLCACTRRGAPALECSTALMQEISDGTVAPAGPCRCQCHVPIERTTG